VSLTIKKWRTEKRVSTPLITCLLGWSSAWFYHSTQYFMFYQLCVMLRAALFSGRLKVLPKYFVVKLVLAYTYVFSLLEALWCHLVGTLLCRLFVCLHVAESFLKFVLFYVYTRRIVFWLSTFEISFPFFKDIWDFLQLIVFLSSFSSL